MFIILSKKMFKRLILKKAKKRLNMLSNKEIHKNMLELRKKGEYTEFDVGCAVFGDDYTMFSKTQKPIIIAIAKQYGDVIK